MFKTVDGGKTWKKVLYVNDKTGVIDVQVNPKNPDEMLVATYERQRDGFDGNDPMKRFGQGAGIYKSTDGGESFMRITNGLPSCKMGRIGLDYFESDPNFVFAIIESEKIAKEPENYSYMGIRGENADVGAKLTSVTKDGPADKAGLKVDDIIVSVNENILASYSDFLLEIHKYQADETVDIVISRDQKLKDIKLKLGNRPKSNGSSRTRRTDFTGTLGGQSANRQGTQGPDGHEYGGVYLSEDGGDSWKRVNSLNPRPMYYSNIQVDPVDRNNVYVCGTSLYKSKDGGKTFTGDGGTDGIHVDHHALWIDKRDSRHMILGNDGGIYITYDRMTHWDHFNHVAIGQFYHVGVDTNLDYKVYGGMQDNGSWGGPSRSATASGPVNTDWYRVGSGDGFVTLVDPSDANQIYFESQNGGMGRIHLETGARGFIRPRERGKRFRFNWKTPFVLSPHNPKIHYSAGNYVFRSFNKGDNTKRISEVITNSDKGAGSAISESPVEAGVIYVGTTDGAVWMTKNGGAKWDPLFYTPEKKEAKEESDAKEAKESKADEKPAEKSDAKSNPPEKSQSGSPKDPVSGSWTGKMLSDRIPEDRAGFNFKLNLESGKITGSMEGRRGSQDISSGSFDSETGDISFEIESQRGSREYVGKLKDGKITGELVIGDGRFTTEFEATRDPAKKDPDAGQDSLTVATLSTILVAIGDDDEVTGKWNAAVESENVPGGRIEFAIEIKKDKQNKLSGKVVSPMGTAEITGGSYVPEKKKVIFDAENDEINIEFSATIDGNEMSGDMLVDSGRVEMEFSATRELSTSQESETEVTETEASEEKTPAGKTDVDQQKSPSDEVPAEEDPVTGKWVGRLMTPGGEQDVTMEIKKTSDTSISGTFESTRGEREITSGSFDPETGELKLVSETDQFTLEFVGKVSGSNYEGEIDINSGQFSMDFSVKKQGKPGATKNLASEQVATKDAEPERPEVESPTGEGSLASLLPGPRWVSSIEASKFKAGRCYMTFDGHRSDDDGVYVVATEDYGKTWKSIRSNLPDTVGSVRVLREDIENENLLFLGCEFSSWVSIDRGATWTRLTGLPTVSVHEFAIHPKAGEIVAGTHGRSLWIADVSVLRQLSKEKLAAPLTLYDVKDAIRWQRRVSSGDSGTRRFVGENPSTGTTIAYSLGQNARQIELSILDLTGNVVRRFEDVSGSKGFHSVRWDLTQGSSSGQRRGRFRRGVASGSYLVQLKVDGQLRQTTFSVEPQPGLSSAAAAELEKQAIQGEFEEILNLEF